MPEKLLSDRKIQAVKPTPKERLLGDGGNLYLRVRSQGKDWLFIYRFRGRQRKLGLGSYPDVGLADARRGAADARKALAAHRDPRADRIARELEEEAKSANPQTVSELFSLWHSTELVSRKDRGKETERMFRKDVVSRIGPLPLSAVKRAHVAEVLDLVRKRGARRVTGHLLADMRQMFGFGIDREYMFGDPTRGLKKRDWGGQSRERTRVLSDEELEMLPTKVATANLQDASVHSIWIILATCVRGGELARAQWVDVDFERMIWRIPAANAKNQTEHIIDLSQFAAAHFQALRVLAKSSPWILPAKHHDGHVCIKSLAKQINDRQRAEPLRGRTKAVGTLVLPNGKWYPHDLRRTGSTKMGDLGIREDVIDRCLNHREPDTLRRIYQHQKLRPEMKDAWHRLGAFLTKICAQWPRPNDVQLELIEAA